MLPKIGQGITIRKKSGDGGYGDNKVETKVVDVFNDIITIEASQEKGRKAQRYELSEELLVEYAENDVTYRFKTFILGINREKQPVIAVKKPKPTEIMQESNRFFLRVLADQEVAVKCKDGPHFVAVTTEVGGDELTFQTDREQPVAEEMTVSCWLLISYRNGALDHIPFDGHITQVKRLEEKQEMTVRIIEIKEPELKKLIRFCYERQLDFRK